MELHNIFVSVINIPQKALQFYVEYVTIMSYYTKKKCVKSSGKMLKKVEKMLKIAEK
jgi:hypothetical protein